MAYTADNLVLALNPVGGAIFPRVFTYYNQTPDADSVIVTAGYFSNGVSAGMRVGDLVDAVNIGTAKYKRYQVTTISGTTVTVAAPTAIT